ncbi:MAG: hypothetical protein M8350_03650 [Methanosarcinaceae archaeon]|nr:hypothetical protein [Methanosarcinaceae archaeon]
MNDIDLKFNLDLIIDDKAIAHLQQRLIDENADAMRIFVSGGGCCSRIEITPVEKELAGDITYERGGVTIHVDKALFEDTSSIEIEFDEKRGLLMNLN